MISGAMVMMLVMVEKGIKKINAVVAGSYPAFLGNVVKKFGDIDVFVIVTDSDLGSYKLLSNRLRGINLADVHQPVLIDYEKFYDKILSVSKMGKIQLVLVYYPCGCFCDHHINNVFFQGFP